MTALLLLSLLAEPAKMPLGFSLLPPDPVLEPSPPPVECADDMTTFEPRPTPFEGPVTVVQEGPGGQEIRFQLDPGILLSECGFTQATNTRIEARRLRLELAALRALWAFKQDQWGKGEAHYQETVLRLQESLREANSPSFWEEWDAHISAVVAVVLTVAVVWGTVELYKALAPTLELTGG